MAETKKKRRYYPNTKTDNTKLVKIEQQTVYRVQQNQKTWRIGLSRAEDVHYPIRYDLYNTYTDVIIDNHLSGIMNLMCERIKGTEFTVVDSNGETDEEVFEKLNSKWFYDFLTYYMNSIFYGHSLVQIHSITNGNIDMVSEVDRFYVSPEWGLILDHPQTLMGKPYRKGIDYDWLFEIGDSTKNLGLLYQISPYILYKKSVIQFWSEYGEIFGTPFRVIKTKNTKPEDRKRLYEFLQNMGSSGYGILNGNEEVQFLESNKSDAYSVYLEFIKMINSEVSKLVLGSTEAVDGASGGSEARSRTHQEQIDAKLISILRNIQFYVNDIMFPKLKKLGVIRDTFNGKFKWINKEKLRLTDKSDVDAKIAEKMVGILDTEYLEATYDVKIAENYNKEDGEETV